MSESSPLKQMKEKALRALARRDYSVGELRMTLRQKLKTNYDESTFKVVLSSLQELGYLVKEEELAERWAKAWRNEGRGRHWISGKLKSKGLPCVDFEDNEDEAEAARYFVNKKMGSRDLRLLSRDEKAKLMRSLISRGFSASLATSVIKVKATENDESI